MQRVVHLALAVFALTCLVGGLNWVSSSAPLHAQQPATAADSVDAEGASNRAEPRGRLPVFYSRVVSGDQRDEIYAIQGRYRSEIEALERQLDELRDRMMEEIEGVLTAEQRTRVEELRAEARARREQKASESEADGETAAN